MMPKMAEEATTQKPIARAHALFKSLQEGGQPGQMEIDDLVDLLRAAGHEIPRERVARSVMDYKNCFADIFADASSAQTELMARARSGEKRAQPMGMDFRVRSGLSNVRSFFDQIGGRPAYKHDAAIECARNALEWLEGTALDPRAPGKLDDIFEIVGHNPQEYVAICERNREDAEHSLKAPYIGETFTVS